MSQRNICFYSNKCKWSEAFIKELSNTPFKQQFRFICVDPPLRQPLPKFLKKVPTLVVEGEAEPRTDGEVMNWLYEQKLKLQSPSQQESSNSDYDGWNMNENVSFPKGNFGYSFNDSDTSSTGNGGSLIPGSFSFLNGATSVGDKASQDFNPGRAEQGRTKSKKEEMFDKQMEEYQRSREMGMPKAQPRV